MSKLITRITRMHIIPEGEPIYTEKGYTVEIDDESGGEFVIVKDGSTADGAGVRIDPKDWIEVRAAVNDLMDQIKRHEKEAK